MSIQSVDEYIKDNFISKEKIRNRIKEINEITERCPELESFEASTRQIAYATYILKDLLEEEQSEEE